MGIMEVYGNNWIIKYYYLRYNRKLRMSLSFPYPKLALISRPPGQGCLSCVHKQYCPAFYWRRRYGEEGRTIDDYAGKQCSSWSSNMQDQVKTPPTEDDLNEIDYMTLHGIGSEPDRCGLTDTVSGTSRRP